MKRCETCLWKDHEIIGCAGWKLRVAIHNAAMESPIMRYFADSDFDAEDCPYYEPFEEVR